MKNHFSDFDYSTKQGNLVDGNLSSHFAKELSDIRRQPFKKTHTDLWTSKRDVQRSKALSFVKNIFRHHQTRYQNHVISDYENDSHKVFRDAVKDSFDSASDILES